jgi:YbbR domain-containing protein
MPVPNTKNDLILSRQRAVRFVRRRWLRELLLEDWLLKLLALAISIALWFGVTTYRAPAAMRLRGVALSFLLPEDMEISNDPREQVEVTLSGEKNKLDALTMRNLTLTADVRGYREGERVARLVPENVIMDLPEGVRIIRVEPRTVPLKLEHSIERQIEVAARLEGHPAEGFEVQGIEITPAHITVRGPASHVQKLERALTETLSLDGLREDLVARVITVDVNDDKIVVPDGVVAVQVKIGEPTIERRFTNVANTVARDGDAPAQSVQNVAVLLRGGRSVLNELKAEELRVVWQGDEGLRSAEFVPRVLLPAKVTGKVEVVSVEPARLMRQN